MIKTKLLSISLFSLALAGCATTGSWSCQISGGGNGPSASCKIQGVWYQQAMNFLRPSVNMLAETMGYTFEDWSSTDFSDFSLRVNGSTVSVKNDEVQVLVYQGGAQIGAKSFSVHRLNDDYYFSDPSSVKNWAYNFVDVADYTDVKFDLEKQSSGVITVAAVENNISKASASTYYKGEAYCEGSICYEEP